MGGNDADHGSVLMWRPVILREVTASRRERYLGALSGRRRLDRWAGNGSVLGAVTPPSGARGVMSSSTSVFIERCPAGEAARLLAEFLGTPLQQRDDDPAVHYGTSTAGIDVSVIEAHGLVDDQGIPFSHYQCEVGFARSASIDDAEMVQELCELLARLFARRVADRTGCECLVVNNLQRLAERVCPPTVTQS
jgi:hypothetical protein